MSLVRMLAVPLTVLAALIVLVGIGLASAQTGWVAIALFCVWPLTWATAAWSFRGIREGWQLVPKQNARKTRENRSQANYGETFLEKS
jgi:hypothetical protein